MARHKELMKIQHEVGQQCEIGTCATGDAKPHLEGGKTIYHSEIFVREGIKRCPECTFNCIGAADPHVHTFGCSQCDHTGRGTFWSAHAVLVGSHYHVTVRAGAKSGGGRLGTLTMRPEEWVDFKGQMETGGLWRLTESKGEA